MDNQETDRYSLDGKIHDVKRLIELQSLPLERKIGITAARIIEWYNHYEGKVYVSFSGGKDSTVLLHMARKLFPDIEGMFINTGLEYPEIQKFVKTFDNITIVRPEMSFIDVIKKYGYPIIGKEVADAVSQAKKSLALNDNKSTYRIKRLNGELTDKEGNLSQYNIPKYKPLLTADFNISQNCCNIMKKKPSKKFEKETGKKPIIATMASEGRLRHQQWLKRGCNAFTATKPMSTPMAFWTEQDVLEYIKIFNVPIASVYGEILQDENGKYYTTGVNRTGCIFCAFGAHLEKEPTRFQRLEETHLRQYEYCLEGGEYDENGLWIPNKTGLGMKHVFDDLNKLFGENYIKYKKDNDEDKE